MKSSDDRVALAERTGKDAGKQEAQRTTEAASKEEKTAEKPRTSGEIVIEEISIDGMCGVY